MDEISYFENVASYKLLAKKEVGQNFLVDPKACRDIVNALEVQQGEKVLEIGCGAGSLTYFLAQTEGDITAIDIDEAMLLKTGKDFESAANVKVIYGNAARYDYAPFAKIIGNLPYYITTSIIENVLLHAEKATKMVFMVQKEAGERISSKVGSKDYSPLSVLLDLGFVCTRIRTVGRNSFVPVPHVESAVYSITKKKDLPEAELEGVYLLAKATFAKRRKTLRNNLKDIVSSDEEIDEALKACHFSPTTRPEEVTPKGYLDLYRALKR